MIYVRTCQECMKEQICPAPNMDKELPLSFTDRKCKYCKSEALDYGSNRADDYILNNPKDD